MSNRLCYGLPFIAGEFWLSFVLSVVFAVLAGVYLVALRPIRSETRA